MRKTPKPPTDRPTLNTDFLTRWTNGETIRVDERGRGNWPDGTPVLASATLPSDPILTERRRCVGIVLREYGIARLAGDEKTAEVLDRLAIYLENPETPPEG